MPFTSIASWIATIAQFIAYWENVNTAHTPDFILNGYTVADLIADRDELASRLALATATENQRQMEVQARDMAQAEMGSILKRFKLAVRGQLTNSGYQPAPPDVPLPTNQSGIWMERVNDAENLWTRINADEKPHPDFTPPLLIGTITLANFTAKRTALFAIYDDLRKAEVDAKQARSNRDEQFNKIYEILRRFRLAVIAFLEPESPFVSTLPDLTPAPGSTPEPPGNFNGTWNEALIRADFTWTPSPSANVTGYQLRACLGLTYNTESENVVANFGPEETSGSSNEGFNSPGYSTSFRLYTMTSTGNESGTQTVTVTYPPGGGGGP